MHIGVGISQNKRGKQVTESVVGEAHGSHCSEELPRTLGCVFNQRRWRSQ